MRYQSDILHCRFGFVHSTTDRQVDIYLEVATGAVVAEVNMYCTSDDIADCADQLLDWAKNPCSPLDVQLGRFEEVWAAGAIRLQATSVFAGRTDVDFSFTCDEFKMVHRAPELVKLRTIEPNEIGRLGTLLASALVQPRAAFDFSL